MKDQWILDLRASFHTTQYGDWSHIYQSCDGIVYMGDDNSYKIVGVGEV